MEKILYGLYSGDELVYVGKIENTAQAYCDESNYHLSILNSGDRHENYMYEHLLDRKAEGYSIQMRTLYEIPDGLNLEEVR